MNESRTLARKRRTRARKVKRVSTTMKKGEIQGGEGGRAI